VTRLRVPASDSGSALERYLADISVLLPGPPGAWADLVAELRSGLLDAVDAHQSAGYSRSQAEQAAMGEFGDAAVVAGGFRGELAARQARRVAGALLASGPVTGLLWICAAQASHLTIRLALPWQQGALSPGLRAGIPLIAAAVAVTACAALLGIATTGRLTRWLPDRPRQAPAAAAVAGYAAVGADALGLALLGLLLATAPGRLSPLLAAAAAVAGLVRLLLASRAARRCLATRAALTAP
jgi:hypothetical protein